MEWKKTLNFNIPMQDQKNCDKYNKMLAEMSHDGQFTPIESTEKHLEDLVVELYNAFWSVAEAGGKYLGDGVKVKIELEYDPEDK